MRKQTPSQPPGPFWLLLRSESLPPGAADWLSRREGRELARYRVAERRRDWLLGRWTAKMALRSTPSVARGDESPSDFEILADDGGAPEAFRRGRRLEVSLSLSHRAGTAFCALSVRGAVGCDVERVEPVSRGFLEDYLTPGERTAADRGGERRDEVATVIWSAKESLLKMRRVGLRVDPRDIDVRPSRAPIAATWHSLSVTWSGLSRRPWGWWRRFDELALTVLSDLAPGPPLALRL